MRDTGRRGIKLKRTVFDVKVSVNERWVRKKAENFQ